MKHLQKTIASEIAFFWSLGRVPPETGAAAPTFSSEERGIPCKTGSAFDLRPAAAMIASDSTSETSDAARRRRRRSNSLLLALAVGFVVFGAAAGALFYVVRPVTLRTVAGWRATRDGRRR
jgi:hypothetical protein